jgi:hypothetical protein
MILAYSDEQRRGVSTQTGLSTTGEGPSQMKHQEAGGSRTGPLAKTHPRRCDRNLPQGVQLRLQEPSSERNDTSECSPRQFDAKPAILKAADSGSDVDRYFNDEDNDAFLAIEDPVSVPCGTGETRGTEIGGNLDRNAMKNESSPGGTCRHPGTASVKLQSQQIVPGAYLFDETLGIKQQSSYFYTSLGPASVGPSPGNKNIHLFTCHCRSEATG